MPRMAKVTLKVTAGPLAGRLFAFDRHDTFLFGRSPDCHAELAADDTTASRHHFLLEVNPPQARLRDLGSLNGTHVNGVKYGGRARQESPQEAARRRLPEVDLRDGDRIRVGATVFDVAIEGHRSTVPADAPEGGAASPLESLVGGRPEGMVVPGYDVGRMIGRGGMGAVYLARRRGDGTTVALKVMLAQTDLDEAARETFQREIEVTRSLRHPRIVALLEHGSAESTFYFAMEYCAGGSVADLQRREPGGLPLALAVRIVREALDGLAFAHERGFVHRDLKPENILLADAAGTGAKVTDFGLAKSFQQAGLSGMTATGAVAGTLYFMPREQLTQFRLLKPVSDVWSMGATLYYMLTAAYAREFRPGEDPLPVILRGGVVPIRARDPRLPEAVAAVVDRAVTDALEERYQTAREFRDALDRAVS
ncbi:MAG: serine/threonine protein kinase [Acidobacteria bacterium]|nr:MAG: serine/threonine protein kinase [Acidobacteriota bacterium]